MHTLYDLIASSTVAFAVNLDPEHNGGMLRCLDCGSSPYTQATRLTDEDMNKIVLAHGVEAARCSKCQRMIV